MHDKESGKLEICMSTSNSDKKAALSRTFSLSPSGILFSLISALCFSTLGIFATALYSMGFSVQQALAWRFTFSSILLWAFLAVRTTALKRRGCQSVMHGSAGLSHLLLLALFGFTPQAGLYFITVKMLAPGITSLLLYLYPSFVLFISAIFLGRKPSKAQVFAVILSFAGCALTFFQPGAYPLLGLTLGVIVALAYSAYLVWGELVLHHYDSIFATAVIMSVATFVYWGWVLISGNSIRLPDSLMAWLSVLGIALFATVLPITTLFAAMRKIGAANVSLISTIEPVSTVLLSLLVFHETLTPGRVVGGVLILTAVIVLQVKPGSQTG